MHVSLETLMIDVPDKVLREQIKRKNDHSDQRIHQLLIPESATRRGVSSDIYDGYRKGLVSACADAVVVQVRDGKPRVPLIRRTRPPFSGCWWVMGGAIFNFRSINQFLLWKIARETRLTTLDIDAFVHDNALLDETKICSGIRIVGCMGVARTAADDTVGEKVCDTLNVCYLAEIAPDIEISHDRDHDSIRFFEWDDLLKKDTAPGHWYPLWAVEKALKAALDR